MFVSLGGGGAVAGIPAGTVVQSLSPSSFQMSNDQGAGGLVGVISIDGGNPNVVTNWALSGADASLFTITAVNDTTAMITNNATISVADDYDITIEVTTSAGTVNFVRVVTVVAPASLLYATPTNLPSQFVTFVMNGSAFEIASTNTGLSVGTQYATPTAIYAALEPLGPTTANLPDANITMARVTLNAGGIAWVGAFAGGQPTTTLTAALPSQDLFLLNTIEPSETFWFKHLKMGPTDAQLAANLNYQFGGSALTLSRNGRINIIGCHVRGSTFNGITGGNAYEWFQRTFSDLRIYDSLFWGCGTQYTEHNIYYHGGKLEMHRSTSRDPGDQGHCLKIENERSVILDNYFDGNTGIGVNRSNSGTGPINATRGDHRFARNVIVTRTTAPANLIQLAARINAAGGFGNKWPAIVANESNTGQLRGEEGIFVNWRDGGAKSSTHNLAQLSVATAAGATSVSVYRIGPDGNKLVIRTLPAVPHTITIALDKITHPIVGAYYPLQEFMATPTASASGTATFTLDGGMYKTLDTDGFTVIETAVGATLQRSAAKNNPVVIKLADPVPYDVISDLNPKHWNDAHAEYMGRALNGGSSVDLTHPEWHYRFIFEDNLCIVAAAGTPINGLGIPNNIDIQYFRLSTFVYSLPPGPMNNPMGPSAEWPDNANYATWLRPLAKPGKFVWGTPPVGFVDYATPGPNADVIQAWPVLVHNMGIINKSAGVLRQFQPNATSDSVGVIATSLTADIRWSNNSGTLTPVTTANLSPAPATSATTAVGAHLSGVSTINVVSTTGMANGKRVHVFNTGFVHGDARSMHAALIQSFVAGVSVTLDVALPFALSGGEDVACFTDAGTRPTVMPHPNQYQTQ